jgi:3',5'-cyclic AMP phosphodiesterase CpdA
VRVQIFSDLHADVRPTKPIEVKPDVDAVIVAGDICEGAEASFAVLRRIVPMQTPIVFVLGNHEFYHRVWSEELAQADEIGIYLPLEGRQVTSAEFVPPAASQPSGATGVMALFNAARLSLRSGAPRSVRLVGYR